MEKPKRRSLPNGCGVFLLVIICVLVFGGFLLGLYSFLGNALKPVVSVGDEFLLSLRDGDYQAAFESLNPNLKNRVENAEQLRGYLLEYNLQPQSWNFQNQEVNNNSGNLAGTVTFKNGTRTNLGINLSYDEEEWQVSYFYFGQHGSFDF